MAEMPSSGIYRIKRKPDDGKPRELHPDGSLHQPYGLWDTEDHCWVNKYGAPDEEYQTCCRDVAVMRRRDLNYYTSEEYRQPWAIQS